VLRPYCGKARMSNNEVSHKGISVAPRERGAPRTAVDCAGVKGSHAESSIGSDPPE
jgi:hypothetical protein